MADFFDDLNGRFHELHSNLVNAIQDLPEEALDWIPGTDMNSIAVLIVHLTGAETYLFGVALDEPPERDREAEFTVHDLSLKYILDRIKNAEEYIGRGLKRLTLRDLESLHISPRRGTQVSTAWCILHSMEHTATHLGHIQLTRQLWEQRKD
jgi:uncharacterized damage-inducible protein DinB